MCVCTCTAVSHGGVTCYCVRLLTSVVLLGKGGNCSPSLYFSLLALCFISPIFLCGFLTGFLHNFSLPTNKHLNITCVNIGVWNTVCSTFEIWLQQTVIKINLYIVFTNYPTFLNLIIAAWSGSYCLLLYTCALCQHSWVRYRVTVAKHLCHSNSIVLWQHALLSLLTTFSDLMHHSTPQTRLLLVITDVMLTMLVLGN